MRKVRSSVGVIGSLLSAGHPCTSLIPLIRQRRLRAFVGGLGARAPGACCAQLIVYFIL